MVLALQCLALWPDLQGDTYIHYTFARRLAGGEFFHFNAGEPSRGSSSPAWTMCLGILHLFGGPPRLILLSKTLSLLFAALGLVAAAALGRRLARDPIAGGCAALALALAPAFAIWTIRAMETAFFVFLVLAIFLDVSSTESAGTPRRAVLSGALLGLGALCRPEGILLAVPAAAVLAWKAWNRKSAPGNLIAALGTAAAVVAPYAAWLLVNFGSPLPSSTARIEFARQWATRHGPFFVNLEYVRLLEGPYAACGLLALAGLAAALRRRETRPLALALGAWLAVSTALYTVVMPTTYGQRYFVPGFAAVAVAAGASVAWIPARLRVAAPALFLLALVPDLRVHVGEFRDTRSYLRGTLVPWDLPARREMAAWVHDHLPPDAVIGAKEVDQLGYYGERRVLSLDGILDTRVLPYLREGRLVDFLLDAGATHVMVEENLYANQPQLRASDLAVLAAADLHEGARLETRRCAFTLVHRTRYIGPPAAPRDVFWYLYRLEPRDTAPSSTSAMRSPARPSQSSGILAARRVPARNAAYAPARPAASAPTSVFVPSVIVTGRSVLSRSVKQGTPRTVVSSWIPPESVSTSAAWSMSARNSR